MKRTVFRWGRAGWQKAESYLHHSGETPNPAWAGDDGGGKVLPFPGALSAPGPSGLTDRGSLVFDIDRRFYS